LDFEYINHWYISDAKTQLIFHGQLNANRVQRTVDSRIKLADIQEELDFLAY